MKRPSLWIIVPCYNESEVIPYTAPLFEAKIKELILNDKICSDSKILFVDDGSTDHTWDIISELAQQNSLFIGIRQSRNRGHQNAVLAGLMEAVDCCDITITIDCDGQDDINAITQMVDEYLNGAEIVYGVRAERNTDTWFKRVSAQSFYRLLKVMGTESIYNHADYRLVSNKVLKHFADYQEVNIYLRGMFPLVGFKSTSIYYERHERLAGKSKYPVSKMLKLAIEGITSISVKPITIIGMIGFFVSLLGLCGIIWAVFMALIGKTVDGWASIVCIVCFMGGLQLLSLGIIGQYVGKTYMETKHRPRYIISHRTFIQKEKNYAENK